MTYCTWDIETTINWRFGARHFQIHRNAPYVTLNVNPCWLENKPSKWFERY